MTRRALALFALMCLLWGIPYLLIRIAVAEVSPAFLVFARSLLAVVVLAPVVLHFRALTGLGGVLPWLAAVTLLEVTLPFLLISYGEQHVTSSLTGLLISSEPLMVALLATRLAAGERVEGRRLAGMLLGLAGVAVLLGLDVGGDRLRLLGAGMVLVAALCYSVAALLIRLRLSAVSQLGVAGATLSLNSALLAVPALVTAPAHLPSPAVLAAIVVLALACTAGGFVGYFSLIQEAGASRAAVITYVNPAVAVVLGALVLGEPIGLSTIAGFVLIVLGSWLATTGGRLRRAVVPAVAEREA